MSWRQSSISKQNQRDSSSLTEIIKIKTELSAYRIQVQIMLSEASSKDEQISQLQAQIQKLKMDEQKHKNQIIKIGTLLNCNDIHQATDLGNLIAILQLQVLENIKRSQQMERKLRKANEIDESQSVNLQRKQKELAYKDQQIKNLNQNFNALKLSFANLQKQSQEQTQKNKSLYEQIQSLQKHQKQLELQAKIARSNSFLQNAQQCKKSCEQLLMQIHVQEDNFLRTYLHKSYSLQNFSSGISNHNKYGFIFRE